MISFRINALHIVLFLSCIILCTTDHEIPPYSPPVAPENANIYFFETFTDAAEFNSRWVHSSAKNEEGNKRYEGSFKIGELEIQGNWAGDKHLLVPEKAKHYGIAAKMTQPVYFEDSDILVVQYEVTLQEGLECGGAYIKLLSLDEKFILDDFHDKTPYTIMFGPDKCGTTSKLHFIIRYQNPITKEFEEKHSTHELSDIFFFTDKKTHIYQLVMHSNGRYSLAVDLGEIAKGNLLTDLKPSIIPLQFINDPEDRKPEDWDDREKIPDPSAFKPEDWDENAPLMITDEDAIKPESWDLEAPEMIPDPESLKPDNWDDNEDGDWEPPMIDNPICEQYGCGKWEPPSIRNPNYKGKWSPPVITNPNYQGTWEPAKIENPDYFEEDLPFAKLSPIGAIGIELWTMSEGIAFDNILLTDSLQTGNYIVKDSWMIKNDLQVSALGEKSLGPWPDYIMEITNQYPFLWGIYAALIVLPFIICCWCLPTKPRQIPKPVTGTETKPDTTDTTETTDATDTTETTETEERPREVPPPFEVDKEVIEVSADDQITEGTADETNGRTAEDVGDELPGGATGDDAVDRGNASEDDADDSAVSPIRRRKTRRDN